MAPGDPVGVPEYVLAALLTVIPGMLETIEDPAVAPRIVPDVAVPICRDPDSVRVPSVVETAPPITAELVAPSALSTKTFHSSDPSTRATGAVR
jgi:hypothetical protein